ncbi:MAG: hypothetical protein UR26_C0001G0219 [candidate division TM6 bacterium GW2011_GWF2_32_72]|nr:MAG: hypothetical protein UR26_C0001G0219 [candidate division TM6 bacterium GW2011_GWF2_32_72]
MTTTIKSLLNNFLDKNDNWKVQLLQKWPQIIGNMQDKVTIEKIYNDTIILGVSDSCWMQELYFLSDQILQVINLNLDQPRIKNLKFKQSEKKIVPNKVITKNVKDYAPIRLRKPDLMALEKITDPQLKEVMEKFLTRCYQEKQ